MTEIISKFFEEYGSLFVEGTWDSLIMVFVSTFFAYVIGLPLGVLVTITAENSIMQPSVLKRTVNIVLGWIVNML